MNNRQRKNRRVMLWNQQQGMCCWCGQQMQLVDKEAPDFGTFEHIVPECHGGTHKMANLLLAHKKCNGERSADRQRIPLFCWVRREFGTEQLKIVKYLDSPRYAAFAPEGPKAYNLKKSSTPFDPFARF